MSTPLLRNFRFMSIAVVGVALVQFALYFVVARYLGNADYGSFAVALTMALLAAPLCGLGMNISIIWSHSRAQDRLPEIVGASLAARGLLALPVGLLAVGVGYALGFSSAVLWMFVPLFAGALLDGVSGLFSAVFQAKEQMGWSSTILLVRNVARACGLGATVVLGGDLWTLALSWAAASGLSALVSAGLVLRHASIRFRAAAIRPMLRDAWPFASAIIANLLLLQSDILMLGHFAGDGTVGLYHVAFRFIVLAELLPQIISMVIIPRSYRIGHHEGPVNLSRFYRVQTLVLGTIGLVGSLVVALHGAWIAQLTLGDGFQHSGVLLTALAPMIFLRFMLVPLGDAMSSLGHQRRLASAAWIACATNVALNLVLIPPLGAIGAALATCCSQGVMLFALMAFAFDTGLDSRWWRLLSQPMFAAAVAALLFALAPGTAPFLVPATLGLLLVMFRAAPTEEYRSVLRASHGTASPATAAPGTASRLPTPS